MVARVALGPPDVNAPGAQGCREGRLLDTSACQVVSAS
jgi:hypothetical protein